MEGLIPQVMQKSSYKRLEMHGFQGTGFYFFKKFGRVSCSNEGLD